MALNVENIQFLYRALLNREADSEGLKHYMGVVTNSNISDPYLLSRMIIQSKEFKLLHRFPALAATRVDASGAPMVAVSKIILDATNPKWISETYEFYKQVEESRVVSAQIEEVYVQKRVPMDNDYYKTHARRFRELFGWLTWQARSRASAEPKLLEIGTSAHTTSLYKPLLGVELNTVCRPPALSRGPTAEWARAMGSDRHWMLDLNELENGATIVDEIPDAAYDFIVCCEVVEHLVVDPSVVIGRFLPKLAPDGMLFLSTPNYFRPGYIEKILRGRNPAQDFKRYVNNEYAHHHFREYTPLELVDCVITGGGKVASVVFSNCWSGSPLDSPEEIPLRENLIVIAKN